MLKKIIIAALTIAIGVPLYAIHTASALGSIQFESGFSVTENHYETRDFFSYTLPGLPDETSTDVTFTADGQCYFYDSSSNPRSQTTVRDVFYANNNSIPVGAINDQAIEGDHGCVISYSIVSDDSNYNGATGSTTIVVHDNDFVPEIKITEKPSSIKEGEYGRFKVVLTDENTAEVKTTITVSGPCILMTVGKTTSYYGKTKVASFDPAYPYIIYELKAEEDTLTSNQSCTVSFGKTQSSDSRYNNMTIPSFAATVINNDQSSSSSSTTSSKPKSTATATTTTTQPPTAISAGQPATEVLSVITANGNDLKKEGASHNFEAGKKITFSGQTVPNGTVVLYVYSEPKKFTTTADENGNWQVDVNELPMGNHHAEIEITDPATNTTTAKTKLVEFAVVSSKKLAEIEASTGDVATQSVKSSSLPLVIAVATVSTLVLAGGGYWYYKKKRAY